MIGWQASTSHYASYYLSGESNSNDVACANSHYSSYNTLVFRLDNSKFLLPPSLPSSLPPSIALRGCTCVRVVTRILHALTSLSSEFCVGIEREYVGLGQCMHAEPSGCAIHVGAEYYMYIFLCDMHIANNYLLITHMQTLRAAPSHATMADVYPTAIDAMETTIAMTTVMKRDAIMTVETTVMKTDVVCYIMVCIVYIYIVGLSPCDHFDLYSHFSNRRNRNKHRYMYMS